MISMQEYGLKFVGTPYVWGGNDTSAGGMDCSGFILELLRSQGLWGMKDGSAQDIFSHFYRLASYNKGRGVLLFFGTSAATITHVALKLNDDQLLEAGGGDSTNKSGMIRIRCRTWRSDLIAEIPV